MSSSLQDQLQRALGEAYLLEDEQLGELVPEVLSVERLTRQEGEPGMLKPATAGRKLEPGRLTGRP